MTSEDRTYRLWNAESEVYVGKRVPTIGAAVEKAKQVHEIWAGWEADDIYQGQSSVIHVNTEDAYGNVFGITRVHRNGTVTVDF